LSVETFLFAVALAFDATYGSGKDVLAAAAAYVEALVVLVRTNTPTTQPEQLKLNLLGYGYSFHGRSKVASKSTSYKEEVSTYPCSTSRANCIDY
jgi:hypothetical protein